jgi:hypothetical protein
MPLEASAVNYRRHCGTIRPRNDTRRLFDEAPTNNDDNIVPSHSAPPQLEIKINTIIIT